MLPPASATLPLEAESTNLAGEFGCILHTGDFRASKEMLTSTPLRNAKVDLLIIDNTFCHPRFDMPPR